MREAVTIEIDAAVLREAENRARADCRTLSGFVEKLLKSELHGPDYFEMEVSIPEGYDHYEDLGVMIRSEGESDAEYDRRNEIMALVFEIGLERRRNSLLSERSDGVHARDAIDAPPNAATRRLNRAARRD